MEKKTTTRKAAKVLRDAGLSVVTGVRKPDDMSNAWVIGQGGYAVVINTQTFSILGRGCLDHPKFQETQEALAQRVMKALDDAGIEYRRRLRDQLLLSGYAEDVQENLF